MKTIDIEVMSIALFSSVPSYLEYATGKMMGEVNVPADQRNNDKLYMLLPAYSLAHVKQLYLRNKYSDSDILSERGLNTYSIFSLIKNQERNLDSTFDQKAHAFIVDHDLEDDYIEFSDQYKIAIATKFCEDNGIPYRFKYPDNE